MNFSREYLAAALPNNCAGSMLVESGGKNSKAAYREKDGSSVKMRRDFPIELSGSDG